MRALACPSQPVAVSLEESAAAASAPTALYDAQACKRMRQRATQHKGEKKTKGRGKNTIEKNSQAAAFCKLWQTHECVLLPAPHSRPPSASKSRRPQHQRRPLFTTRKPANACVREQRNTKARRKQKGEAKTPLKKTAKRLLSASFGKRMNACSCLPLTAGRRQPRRVGGRIISKF
jgi:hypothetical protein